MVLGFNLRHASFLESQAQMKIGSTCRNINAEH